VASQSFHKRSLLVVGIRNSHSTSMKLKKDGLSFSLLRWWLYVVSALPCSLNPIKSHASFDSNLITFMLNHLCIALTQVPRYCESHHFLSPLLKFSGASILIRFIRFEILDDVSGLTFYYCGFPLLLFWCLSPICLFLDLLDFLWFALPSLTVD